MSKYKHTPGPWRIEEGTYYACIRTAAGVIADMRFVGGAVRNTADVSLIAAAPDLLDALQGLVKELSDSDDEGLIENAEPMIAARAAIAKATGATK